MDDGCLTGKRILVVDDDADLFELIGRILADSGGQVLWAPTAQRASDMLVEHGASLDAVLLDLRLPDGDGADMIGRLQVGAVATIPPILIVSAWSRDKLQQGAEAIGAKGFLVKPFGVEELVQRLADITHMFL